MKEVVLVALLCFALYIVVPVATLVLRDRIADVLWRRRNPPEKLAAERLAYEARIASPDWEFYERHLQRRAPAALRELFSEHTLTRGGVDYDKTHYVSSFEPLDAMALVDTRELLGFEVVPLASSDGDIIYLRPGAMETDAIFITYHDGGDTEQLAPDVSTFLRQLRESNAGAS